MSGVKETGIRPSPPVSAERHAEAVSVGNYYQGLWLNASGKLSLAQERLGKL